MIPTNAADYRFLYPDMPRKALSFFSIANTTKTEQGSQPRTIYEFIKTYSDSSKKLPNPAAVDAICQALCRAGWLTFGGARGGTGWAGLNNSYLSIEPKDIDELSFARQLNFVVYGFPCIYDTLKFSVLPIVHVSEENVESLGTGFVIASNVLVTAAHCLLGAKRLSVRSVPATALANANFYTSTNQAIDLGMVRFSEPVFAEIPSIAMAEPVLLQEVMALGYPNVPTFVSTIAAEKALISSRLTATRGSLASTPFEIFAKTELLLITARVRGGFSGGPILNELGSFVGVVSRAPFTMAGDIVGGALAQYDDLGYGTAIPAYLASDFVQDALRESNEVAERLSMTGVSFSDFIE